MFAWLFARLRAVLIPPPPPALARIPRSAGAAHRRPLRRRTIDL
jgi:hypothetical protein